MWWSGGWSIASGPHPGDGVDEIQYAKGHKYLTGLPDREGLHATVVDRQGPYYREFRAILHLIGEPLSESIKFVARHVAPSCGSVSVVPTR